jgi:hypothetical protein
MWEGTVDLTQDKCIVWREMCPISPMKETEILNEVEECCKLCYIAKNLNTSSSKIVGISYPTTHPRRPQSLCLILNYYRSSPKFLFRQHIALSEVETGGRSDDWDRFPAWIGILFFAPVSAASHGTSQEKVSTRSTFLNSWPLMFFQYRSIKGGKLCMCSHSTPSRHGSYIRYTSNTDALNT